MVDKRIDMIGDIGKDCFGMGYFCSSGKPYRDLVGENRRPTPIVVDNDMMKHAHKILVEKGGKFQSFVTGFENINDIYIFNGALVHVVGESLNPLQYLGVLHETEIGVAYAVNMLELPTDGPRWSDEE